MARHVTDFTHVVKLSMSLKGRGTNGGTFFIKNYKSLIFSDLFLIPWSWRGLNPRPNVELIRFLHA